MEEKRAPEINAYQVPAQSYGQGQQGMERTSNFSAFSKRQPDRGGYDNNNSYRGYNNGYNNNNNNNYYSGGRNQKQNSSNQNPKPRYKSNRWKTGQSRYVGRNSNEKWGSGIERSTQRNMAREKFLFGDDIKTNAGINFDKYNDIPVEMSGKETPEPVKSFAESKLPATLLENIERCKFLSPTPVQAYSIPIVIDERDLMGCAQTGSGKTAAFLLPSIAVLIKKGEVARTNQSHTPFLLILAPTRELAQQTHFQAQKFCYMTGYRANVVYGGASVEGQIRNLQGGCDILVATPGRLYDLIDRGVINLAKVSIFILDEADRMLDMGFEPQIRAIVNDCNMPDKSIRQTLMFSATFPEEIQRLAQDFLQDYIFLAVGRVGSTTEFIKQEVEYVPDFAKPVKLLEFLQELEGRTLVFTQTKKKANYLDRYLNTQNIRSLVIHGDKNQRERERALSQFRKGFVQTLVATDVAARGLDIPNVLTVIQYDAPSHIDDYVHRIGRTGRCGNEGRAITFINEDNKPILIDLINTVREAGQDVPEWYVNMCGMVLQRENGRKKGRFGGRDYRKGTTKAKNFGRKRFNNQAKSGKNNQKQNFKQDKNVPENSGNRRNYHNNKGGFAKKGGFNQNNFGQNQNQNSPQNQNQKQEKGQNVQNYQTTPNYANLQNYHQQQQAFNMYNAMSQVPTQNRSFVSNQNVPFVQQSGRGQSQNQSMGVSQNARDQYKQQPYQAYRNDAAPYQAYSTSIPSPTSAQMNNSWQQ